MITVTDSVFNASNNIETIKIDREKNVKKPYVSGNIAILYTPRSITLKPRSSKEINFGVILDYADYLIPEYDLLPSFKTDLTLILPEEEVRRTKLILTLMNKSFSKTYRITKNTGLVVFQVLNSGLNLHYNNKYLWINILNQSINQINEKLFTYILNQ